MNEGFTESQYRAMIGALLDLGYRDTTYRDVDPDAPRQVVLRHDVDFSLEDALRIARIEAELGVTSSYQLLMTMETYNPFSGTGQRIIAELRDLGHRIGLHLDPMVVADGDTASPRFRDALSRLFDVARHALGELDCYSVHRPATNGKLDDLKPERLDLPLPPYADCDDFRQRLLYRSDSRRQWRHGSFMDELPGLEGRSLQLVTHPIWWTPHPCSREEVLADFVQRQQRRFDVHLADNLSFYDRRYASID